MMMRGHLATPRAWWYHVGSRPAGRVPSKGSPIRIRSFRSRLSALAIGFLTAGVVSVPSGPAGWVLAKAPAKVLLQGSVVNEDGQPVSGLPVRLLMTRNLLRPMKMESEDQVVEAAKTLTGDDGFFEMEVDRMEGYEKFFLRFYDSGAFDSVRYRIPEDREITRKWKQKRPIIVTVVLQDSPDWPEVQEWIGRYGEGSDPALILRSLGLPDRVVDSGQEGVVDWCFDKHGICYHLKGDEVLGRDPQTGAAADRGEG